MQQRNEISYVPQQFLSFQSMPPVDASPTVTAASSKSHAAAGSVSASEAV